MNLLSEGFVTLATRTVDGSRARFWTTYWRKIELILPMFISRSHFASRFSSLQDSMSSFRKKYSVMSS